MSDQAVSSIAADIRAKAMEGLLDDFGVCRAGSWRCLLGWRVYRSCRRQAKKVLLVRCRNHGMARLAICKRHYAKLMSGWPHRCLDCLEPTMWVDD